MRLGSAVPVVLAGALATVSAACKRRKPPARSAQYTPGDWQTRHYRRLGMRLTHPNNLTVAREERRLVLSAPGLGRITIVIAPSGDKRTLREARRYDRGRIERDLLLPGRRITCRGDGIPRGHIPIARRICDSVVFTERLIQRLRVEQASLRITGKAQDPSGLRQAIARAEERVRRCWTHTAERMKHPPEGVVSLRIRRREKRDKPRRRLSYPGAWNADPKLRPCLEAALAPVRLSPADRDVGLVLRLSLLAY